MVTLLLQLAAEKIGVSELECDSHVQNFQKISQALPLDKGPRARPSKIADHISESCVRPPIP